MKENKNNINSENLICDISNTLSDIRLTEMTKAGG